MNSINLIGLFNLIFKRFTENNIIPNVIIVLLGFLMLLLVFEFLEKVKIGCSALLLPFKFINERKINLDKRFSWRTNL